MSEAAQFTGDENRTRAEPVLASLPVRTWGPEVESAGAQRGTRGCEVLRAQPLLHQRRPPDAVSTQPLPTGAYRRPPPLDVDAGCTQVHL